MHIQTQRQAYCIVSNYFSYLIDRLRPLGEVKRTCDKGGVTMAAQPRHVYSSNLRVLEHVGRLQIL